VSIGTPQGLGSNNAGPTVTSLAITTTAAINSGDLVVVAIGYNNINGGAVSTVSDGTNSYSKAVGTKNGNAGNEVWYKENATAVPSGSAITVTMQNSTNRLIIEAARVAGIVTSSSLDKTATGTTSAVSGALSQADELVIGTFGGWNVTAITEDAAFTNRYSIQQSTSQVWENLAFKIVSATTSITYQPTITGDSTAYVFAVASFKGGTQSAVLPASPGTFTLTGVATPLSRGIHLLADTGAFVLSGKAILLGNVKVLIAAAGSFTLTGKSIVAALLSRSTLIRRVQPVLQKLRSSDPSLGE
jgi:hypothetical protein